MSRNNNIRIKSRISKSARSEEIAGYLFLLPNLLGVAGLIMVPVIGSLLLGFANWNLAEGLKGVTFAGFDNFQKLFTDVRFLTALKNNLIYTFTTVPITVVLAVILAAILNKAVYAKPVIRAMLFMPYVSSMVAVSVVWNVLLYPYDGPVNSILKSVFHIQNPPGWFTDKDWAMVGLVILAVWYTVGYYMIILIAGMQNISSSYYEAAEIDGANAWHKFRNITVPIVSPTIFFVLIIATINSFKVFDQIKIITDGGPGYSTTVLVYEIYRNAFGNYDFGYASAISWVLFLLVLILTIVQFASQKKWVHY